MSNANDARPWYREPWPWIVMAAPASAVVAGMAMLWLAIDSNDGLVIDDYYKQGLAINQVILRDQEAARLRFRAHGVLSDDGSNIRIVVSSAAGAALPEKLQLRLVHPTRAGRDQAKVLAAQPGGLYETRLPPLTAGRWMVTIEDANKTWRLSGKWQVPEERAVVLEPAGERSAGAH